MDIKKLKETDIGRWVEHGTKGKGRIKYWTDRYIFVVYHCDGQWDHYQVYIAAATRPGELRFMNAGRN